jgi:hypothetical protein
MLVNMLAVPLSRCRVNVREPRRSMIRTAGE